MKSILYGLIQTLKAWNTKFTDYLNNLRVNDTNDDIRTFYYKSKSVMIGLFVDNGIIIGHEGRQIKDILTGLTKKFEITSKN